MTKMKARAKLTIKERWFMFWGFRYVVNHRSRSKEIHNLERKHKNCQTERISARQFVTLKQAQKLIKNHGYNGCRWCWKEVDNG
ncbi:MAG TPA: hypothetical protein DHV48_03580 [Prolixibacteraceae bacterium]|nr:hypothetical protein [Prolixibacteraceae bacterium]